MKWRCLVCGYIHEGENPPDICPVCGASKEEFVLVEEEKSEEQDTRELEAVYKDIIIIGSGGAALTAAIMSIDAGYDLEILEKGETVGGTSARSGGRLWIPNNKAQKKAGIVDDREAAIKYMASYAFPTDFNEDKKNYGLEEDALKLIESYYDTGYKLLDKFEELGVMEFELEENWKGEGQLDYMDLLPHNKSIRGRTIRPKTEKSAGVTGFDYVHLMYDWIKKHGYEARLGHRAIEILEEDDRVVGVRVISEQGRRNFYARKAVIFGSGGFSHNKDLMNRFQYGPSFGGCAYNHNEGDLIMMGEKIGLRLGNMANAYRNQTLFEQAIDNPGGVNSIFYTVGDSFIQVDKYGRRVMNEKRNYNDRAKIHFEWDPVKGEWKNQLLFLVMDERTASNWQGFPPLTPVEHLEDMPYIIAARNPEELGINISERLEELREHVGQFSLDPSFSKNLEASIQRFNGFARSGIDEDFHRGLSDFDSEFFTFPPTTNTGIEWPARDSKNPSMYPMDQSRGLYAFILSAGTLDTNGGPIINSHGQMIDYKGEAVPGLYGAGNCVASASSGAYWGAGATLGSAMIFGTRAVKHIKNRS